MMVQGGFKGVLGRMDTWHRKSLWLSLLLTAILGSAYALHLGTTLHYSDEHDYVSIANNLVHHGRFSIDGVHPTAYRAPGYPLVLALLAELHGGILTFRLLNVVFGLVTVAGGWWIARTIAGNRVATLAAPLLALYPLRIYTQGTLYPETLGIALLVVGMATTISIRDSEKRYPLAVIAGLSFGALVLTIPNTWLPALLCVLWLGFARPRLPLVAVTVAGVGIGLISIWVARNAIVLHSFIPVTDGNGYNLLLANSPHASIRAGVDTNITSYVHQAMHRKLSEVATDSFYRSSALHWIDGHPAHAILLYLGRVLDYFAPFDQLATVGQQSTFTDAIATVTYVPLLAFLILRCVRWRTDRPSQSERLMIAVYLGNALVAAIFVTRVRYRLPFDMLLIPIAAAALMSWFTIEPFRLGSKPKRRIRSQLNHHSTTEHG